MNDFDDTAEAEYIAEEQQHNSDKEPSKAMTVRHAMAAIEKPAAASQQITAAQAKVEAVAQLTMKAYERASLLQLTPEESKALQADFPDDAFQPGAAGKENLIYIEHAHLRDRMNSVFGLGQWSIVPRNRWAEDYRTAQGKPASRVYVEAMLLIRGCFVAEAVGDMTYYPNNDSQNYGDAVEGAKTAALRRCAKELGIGLQAWKKDWCLGWWERRRNATKPKPAPSKPTTQAPAQSAPATTTQRSAPVSDGDQVVPVCTVKSVVEKHSKPDAPGKPWTAWFCKFDDEFGEIEAGTFSGSIGALALEVKDTGETMKLVYRPGKRANTFEIVSLERVDQPPTPEGVTP